MSVFMSFGVCISHGGALRFTAVKISEIIYLIKFKMVNVEISRKKYLFLELLALYNNKISTQNKYLTTI